jgi:polar amino acid transport system permease protein
MSGWRMLFGAEGWMPHLLNGAAVTILLALCAVVLGFGGGLMLALMRVSPSRALRWAGEAYTTFFRGIPDLLALFIVYFGLQMLLNRLAEVAGPSWRIDMNAFVAGVVSLAVVAAAYSSEVWIAALRAVPPGQRDAAAALGMHRPLAFRLVILPLLGRLALPGLGNLWTIILKDTSLISTIAVTDLLRAASEAARATTSPILFYGAATALYLVLSSVSGAGQAALERRANRGFA